MKRCLALLIAVAVAGCEGPQGPAGPAGEPGEDGEGLRFTYYQGVCTTAEPDTARNIAGLSRGDDAPQPIVAVYVAPGPDYESWQQLSGSSDDAMWFSVETTRHEIWFHGVPGTYRYIITVAMPAEWFPGAPQKRTGAKEIEHEGA